MNTPANILIVDDDDELKDVIALIVTKLGYSVIAAASAVEALALLDTSIPVDIVITDLRMPGMSGLELASRLSNIQSPPRVLFVSGVPLDYTAGSAGALQHQFLHKPFTMEALRIKIEQLLSAPQEQ